MTLNGRIRKALGDFGDPVVPGLYTGEAERYYTFNYDLVPMRFADNRPIAWKALVQVHFFCPLSYDSVQRKAHTVLALGEAGFGWPEVVDASDKDAQHYVFECDCTEGVTPSK